ARSYFAPFPPSSPQIAIMKDKKVLFMLERHQIQNRTADQVASDLTAAFNEHCA
ncbi:MAG: BrxA/BrxB family bacilliredoxin, partial [Acidobacteria bacterium]|nr:BrxA/BrxB family bacilliredoxin [Acidobacteriota bacterium]